MVTTTTGLATSFIQFSRPGATGGGATVTDQDGRIKWAGHNLAINSGAPATQNITTLVGARYTVEMTGSGSVALSGAGTGTASTGTPATITATTTTLTLTVSGTVSTMWAYRSDLGGMAVNPANSTTYYPTTSAAYYAPRLDFDPVTLAARGLLVEEQRSNLVLQSAAFDAAAWTPFALNTTGTPQWINVATAPDGTMTADKIIPDTSSTNVHAIASASITVANATAHTWSVYAKADGYDWLGVVAYTNSISYLTWFNVATGAVGTNAPGNTAHPPVAVGNGWYRLSVTRTTANTVALFILYAANGDNQPTFAGDGTKGVLVWGTQLEAGSFPTSLIPTGASTATRTADVASVSTQAFPYSATAGTLILNATSGLGQGFLGSVSRVALTLHNGGTSNAILMDRSITTTPRVVVTTSGSSVATLLPTGTWSDNQTAKLGTAWATDDFAASFNGGTVAVDPSGAVPLATMLQIGSYQNSSGAGDSGQWSGYIRQITYLPRRLTNAELQSRTA